MFSAKFSSNDASGAKFANLLGEQSAAGMAGIWETNKLNAMGLIFSWESGVVVVCLSS